MKKGKSDRMKNYNDVKARLLQDSETREEYENLSECYELARIIIQSRVEAGLTQTELALRMGTKQSNISRLESGRCTPGVDQLHKVAKATGRKLVIDIV